MLCEEAGTDPARWKANPKFPGAERMYGYYIHLGSETADENEQPHDQQTGLKASADAAVAPKLMMHMAPAGPSHLPPPKSSMFGGALPPPPVPPPQTGAFHGAAEHEAEAAAKAKAATAAEKKQG